MSYNNPTKGQVLQTLEEKGIISVYAEFYNKGHHTAVVRKYINRTGNKPTLENSEELFQNFLQEWETYYETELQLQKEREYSPEFYRVCVPLKVDVEKAVRKFEGTNSVFPMTYIIESNRMEEFKEWVRVNKGELHHYVGGGREREENGKYKTRNVENSRKNYILY